MRAIWKGSISFGLVNIPISLFAATKREDLKFRQLRKSDLSPVNYKRVAEVDGKEVEWGDIVKGYEYEKGKFVVLNEEDFKRVDIEATQTIDITDFVELDEVNPMFFNKPYYIEAQKGGEKAYVLLRNALRETGKVGIATVVIKTRQYLAAVKANQEMLVLELMYFADELVDADEFKHASAKTGEKEIKMAKSLIDSMTGKWDPERYKDEYREAMLELIEEKIESGGKEAPKSKAKAKRSGKVIDLVSVLQQSIDQAAGKKKTPARKASGAKRKKAA